MPKEIKEAAPAVIAGAVDFTHLHMVYKKKSQRFDHIRKHREGEGQVDHPDVERLREMVTANDELETALCQHEIVANRRKEEKRAAAGVKEKRLSARGREK
jgi:hypothetical protein